jgi:sugar lactone lactonase YvrE
MRKAELLADGFHFGKAPRWRGDRLWFSDVYGHAVKSVSPDGDLRVEVEIDDRPSGLGWMPDGSLLIVSATRRRVLRRSPDGAVSVHADLSGITDFHCYDMVVDSAGGAYVGNFGLDLDPEVEKRGVVGVLTTHATTSLAYVAPDGTAKVAADDMHFPNGLTITPDARTLIVSETLARVLTAFDIGEGGALSNRRVWARPEMLAPCGVALDGDGALWVANPMASECARIAEGGEILEKIATEDPCYSCMLGGSDGRTLFMLTAPNWEAQPTAAAQNGLIVCARVDSPRAGWP